MNVVQLDSLVAAIQAEIDACELVLMLDRESSHTEKLNIFVHLQPTDRETACDIFLEKPLDVNTTAPVNTVKMIIPMKYLGTDQFFGIVADRVDGMLKDVSVTLTLDVEDDNDINNVTCPEDLDDCEALFTAQYTGAPERQCSIEYGNVTLPDVLSIDALDRVNAAVDWSKV